MSLYSLEGTGVADTFAERLTFFCWFSWRTREYPRWSSRVSNCALWRCISFILFPLLDPGIAYHFLFQVFFVPCNTPHQVGLVERKGCCSMDTFLFFLFFLNFLLCFHYFSNLAALARSVANCALVLMGFRKGLEMCKQSMFVSAVTIPTWNAQRRHKEAEFPFLIIFN